MLQRSLLSDTAGSAALNLQTLQWAQTPHARIPPCLPMLCHCHARGCRAAAARMQVLPPVMLPVARADGSYSHLRGQSGMLVFFNDKGWLFAHKADGSLLWEVR